MKLRIFKRNNVVDNREGGQSFKSHNIIEDDAMGPTS